MSDELASPGSPSRSLTLKPERLAGSERCLNCGTELQGPFCHYCGQPDKRLLRFFPVLVREFFEDFLELDTRFSRTMVPLLVRPGRLTRDYLDGRRFRYTPPIRLFIFSSMLFFILAATLAGDAIYFNTGDDIDRAEIATLSDPEKLTALSQGDPEALARFEEEVQRAVEAQEQADETNGEESGQLETETTAEGTAAEENAEDQLTVRFNDKEWDRETNPLIIPGMPDWFNDWINDEIEQSPRKAEEIKENPNIFVDEFFELLPATMFIMLPIVALLFKFWYLFAKKYYLEHLIHALHNHAFLFVVLTITLLNNALIEWRDPEGVSALWQSMIWLNVAIYVWIPIYLLISLKTVYQQGWFLTVGKYCVIGISYIVLLTFITMAVALLSFLLL